MRTPAQGPYSLRCKESLLYWEVVPRPRPRTQGPLPLFPGEHPGKEVATPLKLLKSNYNVPHCLGLLTPYIIKCVTYVH